MQKNVNIQEQESPLSSTRFLDTYVAGIQLTGTEIKSIRQRAKARITESFCEFNDRGRALCDQHVHRGIQFWQLLQPQI